jgi:nucleotide-binding universal stress UspA family protein
MFPIRTILHPTDFSEPSEYAFCLACSLARDHNARLLVLHVAQPPVEGLPRPPDYECKLWGELQRIQAPDLKVHLEHLLREGDASTEIPRIARECHCDLIVMGAHGWARGDRLLMGSVTHAVFSNAPCLLLIVRPPFPECRSGPGAGIRNLPQNDD